MVPSKVMRVVKESLEVSPRTLEPAEYLGNKCALLSKFMLVS